MYVYARVFLCVVGGGRGDAFTGKLYAHDLVLCVFCCCCCFLVVVGFFVAVVVVVWREQVNDTVRGNVFTTISLY